MRAVGLLLRWCAVKGIAPSVRPPTHLPARHQPYLTHSDTLFPRLRAPRLGSATHRLQSAAARVGERAWASVCACVCVLQQTLRCPSTEFARTVLTLNSHQAPPSVHHSLLHSSLIHVSATKFFLLLTHAGERFMSFILYWFHNLTGFVRDGRIILYFTSPLKYTQLN